MMRRISKTVLHIARASCGVLACGIALASLAACASRGGPVPYATSELAAPDSAASAMEYDWRLTPLDTVVVTVFKVPELSGEYQVSADGHLDLPLIGTVPTSGEGPNVFAQRLERLYGERYLVDPSVTVRIKETNQHKIVVEGGVRDAGVFELEGVTSLLGAVALAKGVEPQVGNPRRVVIFRQRDGQPLAAAFDLVAIRRGEMPNPLVYPGDVVVIDANSVRSNLREILQALPLLAVFRPY